MAKFFSLVALIPTIFALIHYFRNRPESYWVWIIILSCPFGAVVYYIAVVATGTKAVDGYEGKFKTGLKERGQMKKLLSKVQSGRALPYDYAELGDLQFKLRKYAEAVKSLEISVVRAPENKEAMFYLGLSLEKLGRYKDAGRYLESLIVRDSKFKFGEAFLALARCYQGAGETKAAISAYRKVLSQNSFAQARYNLAELLASRGETNEAKHILNKLINEGVSSELPFYQRRQDQKWVRKAKSLLAKL